MECSAKTGQNIEGIFSQISEVISNKIHKIHQKLVEEIKKVTAIKEASVPENHKQLMSFLGMITYSGRFIPNLSTLTSPLRQLL